MFAFTPVFTGYCDGQSHSSITGHAAPAIDLLAQHHYGTALSGRNGFAFFKKLQINA
ncbi:hypothetical protein HMPREF0201_04830 [Cedecea davisae DSM 4568]|uniref:Uncharacterized protein n=1 Tax=Cedecea davisae DSM 4568 TaxID=566551 RepID=S3JGF6_9ENTR|nr:hypothetical protein HMPREF0201_04830 [Cedecea davisae DSM 4568]